MSLRRRFLLSLLAVLGLMAGPALFAASRVLALRDIVLELRGEAAQSALAVGRLEAALVQVDRQQRAYVATADPDFAARMRAATNRAAGEASALRDAGHGELVDVAAVRISRIVEVNRRIEELVTQGELEVATDYLLDQALPEIDRARAAVPALAAAIDAKTGERAAVAKRSAIVAGTATTAAVFIAALLAAALAIAAARVLTQPVERLRLAMARVADGSLEAPVHLPYDRVDEVGELARSFRTMTQRLAELDRLRAEFVGSTSHDLKTPISIIAGYAELIHDELRGPSHARHRELLRSLSEQAQTLQRRVDQLLEISRMEAGRVQLGLEEINVRYFATELLHAFEPTARARELRLELHVHDAVPPFLVADPDVLRTDVLNNLIDNALRFTPAGGVIRIAILPDADRVNIEVDDTGRGMTQEQLDHLFDRYYQGAGLGLAIAKAGVEAHGGRIHVISRPGRGTRVRVSLPVRATHAPVPTLLAAV
ncbi:MAG TPA: HAMP domain-containing sensor histidine kinase [Longimicrobiales bacterium]